MRRGDGSAVSLPQNNIVGKRHCRLLILGNVYSDSLTQNNIVRKRHCRLLILGDINSDVTGFELS